MAENIIYGMGQLRYNENTPYINNLNFQAKKQDVTISSDDDSGKYFQDIMLSSSNANFSFAYGTSYLLRLEIPKDLNYNAVYKVKLLPKITSNYINSSITDFQLVKYIEISKQINTVSKNSRVVLYPVNSSNKPWNGTGSYTTKVAIAKLHTASNIATGDVVYNSTTQEYYIHPKSSANMINNKNDQIMNHVWDKATSQDTDIVTYDIVFSPRISDIVYNNIWIEMVRDAEDGDIYFDGKYGRRINFANFKASVYSFTNLINSDYLRQISSIEHLGIYGHPNLILAINGEEIRIGQSGYYELNDFEITSLGIAVHSNKDRFTLDYQYRKQT